MASAQVVETSVNTNNSPSQDYTTNPDDHSNHNIIPLPSSHQYSYLPRQLYFSVSVSVCTSLPYWPYCDSI